MIREKSRTPPSPPLDTCVDLFFGNPTNTRSYDCVLNSNLWYHFHRIFLNSFADRYFEVVNNTLVLISDSVNDCLYQVFNIREWCRLITSENTSRGNYFVFLPRHNQRANVIE